MATHEPKSKLDKRYSSPDATAKPWSEADEALSKAELYWLSTVRPEGRPHVAPLIGLWIDGSFYFCTGADERKAMNLASNPECIVTTGCNSWNAGFDIVVEGEAKRIDAPTKLQELADAYGAKYDGWNFEVRDGGLYGDGGLAIVFEVTPATAFGFGKGEPFTQTRWRF
jgi:general stress protein 26